MKQICFLFLFLSLSLHAQFQVDGLVTTASSHKPLAFATVIGDNGAKTITDVDGKFSLITKKNIIIYVF